MLRALKIATCIVLILSGCREPYDPFLETGVLNYLVVEGFISGNGSTSIRLSRTQQLTDKAIIKNELKANLLIEGDNGNSFPLSENGDGLYTSAAFVLQPDRQYRIRIKTSDGEEYLSEYTKVKNSPDNKITWSRDPDGLRVRVSTEDKTNQTKYYQWQYEETWEIRSFKPSEFVAQQTRPYVTVQARNPSQIPLLFNCWRTEGSPFVLIASTAGLSGDFVNKFNLSFIPNGSDKLVVRFSMLLKQYALSREAYDYFLLMRKNTETMGSLFDLQPSMERGNIKCISDPKKIALGFVVAANAVEKRIFLTPADVGGWKSSLICDEKAVVAHRDSINKYFTDDQYLITGGVLNVVYNRSTPICVDCRLRGNSTKPSFW